MYYQIKEKLTPCSADEVFNPKPGDPPYVVVMDPKTWYWTKEQFDMVIDIEMDPLEVLETKAIVNLDSLTGTFYVPRRSEMGGKPHKFAFALDEKGIIFIEYGEYAAITVEKIREKKHCRVPSLERFIYDFLEMLIEKDLHLLINTEQELREIEDQILESGGDKYPDRLNEIRSFLMDMRIHYEQMLLLTFGKETCDKLEALGVQFSLQCTGKAEKGRNRRDSYNNIIKGIGVFNIYFFKQYISLHHVFLHLKYDA